MLTLDHYSWYVDTAHTALSFVNENSCISLKLMEWSSVDTEGGALSSHVTNISDMHC